MTFCSRAVPLFAVLAVNAFTQTNGNFSLSTEQNSASVGAGTNASSEVQVTAVSGFTQPIYLIPGVLPQGVSVQLPSPVVGSQKVQLQVHVDAGVKPGSFPIAIYAAGGGENRSTLFLLTVSAEEAVPTAAAPEPSPLSSTQERHTDPHWVGTWGASAVTPSNEGGAYYLTNVTIRQIAHLSIGTRASLRIRLSNALGRQPVSFGSAHVARWAGNSKNVSSAIVPETDATVTFDGADTVSIPPGEEVISDPILMPLPVGADLAVSLYIPRTSNVPATMHTFGNQTAYFSLGDTTRSITMPNAVTDTVRPYLTGIEVDAPGASAVVALGDSLTDGMLSTKDQNLRWPDDLARRLSVLGVVNSGIAGNCVLIHCMGPTLLDRFERDVLSISGVRFLILQAGVNDIGNAPELTAALLTDAYKSLVAMAHAKNILVYGATIPPFGGSHYFTAAHESLRQEVNAFIRTRIYFDGIIDFDKTLADLEKPGFLRAPYNGDQIRPNDSGYQAMADSIDLGLFDVGVIR